jgi:hypothetical protein
MACASIALAPCVRAGAGRSPGDSAGEKLPVVERTLQVDLDGRSALADPAKITDYHWLDDPDWGAKTDYLYAQCNWQLVNDNLSTHASGLRA